MSDQQWETLISGYIDGELTQQDRQKVELMLEKDARAQAIYGDLSRNAGAVKELKLNIPPELATTVVNDATSRSLGGVGWLLSLTGAALLTGSIIHEAILDPELPALVKISLAALAAGGLALLLQVGRQRWIAAKTDKYKGVKI